MDTNSCAIYGAGYSGAEVYAKLISTGRQVDLIVDSNKDLWGKEGPGGVVIRGPHELLDYEGPLHIGCAGGIFLREKLEQEFGIAPDYTINWALHKSRLVDHWKSRGADFLRISDIWRDQASVHLWHLLNREEHLSNEEILDLPVLRDYFEEFFDQEVAFRDILVAGASVGEELRSLDAHAHLMKRAFLYEPNELSFEVLEDEIAGLRNKDVFLARPLALGESHGHLYLTAEGVTSKVSRPQDSSKTASSPRVELMLIEQSTIDSEVEGLQIYPSIITFDVEGAEMNALVGARQAIDKFRPILAISAYHNPNDLFDILSFVDDLKLGYEYELRARDFGFVDLTVFCIPTKG